LDAEIWQEMRLRIHIGAAVQHILHPFCLTVYERHAKLAIDHSDLNHFDQSMDVLDGLYPKVENTKQLSEFGCWRILFLIGCMSELVQFALSAWKAAAGTAWV
jgi:hypothetical protein